MKYYYLPTGNEIKSSVKSLMDNLKYEEIINDEEKEQLSGVLTTLLEGYADSSDEIKDEWKTALKNWHAFVGMSDSNVPETKADFRNEVEKAWHALNIYDRYAIKQPLKDFIKQADETDTLSKFEQNLYALDMRELMLRKADIYGDEDNKNRVRKICTALDNLLEQSARLRGDDAVLNKRRDVCEYFVKRMEDALGYNLYLPKNFELRTAGDFRKYVETRRKHIYEWLSNDENKGRVPDYLGGNAKVQWDRQDAPWDLKETEKQIDAFVERKKREAKEREEREAEEYRKNQPEREKEEAERRAQRERDALDVQAAYEKTRRFFAKREKEDTQWDPERNRRITKKRTTPGQWHDEANTIPLTPMPKYPEVAEEEITRLEDYFEKAKDKGTLYVANKIVPTTGYLMGCIESLVDSYYYGVGSDQDYTNLYKVCYSLGMAKSPSDYYVDEAKEAAKREFQRRSPEDFKDQVERVWTHIHEMEKFLDDGMLLSNSHENTKDGKQYEYSDKLPNAKYLQSAKEHNTLEWFAERTRRFYNRNTPIDSYPELKEKEAEFAKKDEMAAAKRKRAEERREAENKKWKEHYDKLKKAKKEAAEKAKKAAEEKEEGEKAEKAAEEEDRKLRIAKRAEMRSNSGADKYVLATSTEDVSDILTIAKRDAIQDAFETIKDEKSGFFGHKRELEGMQASVKAYLELKEKLAGSEKLNEQEKETIQNAYNACREYLKKHLKEGKTQTIGGQGSDYGRLRKQAVVNMLECMESLPEFAAAQNNYAKSEKTKKSGAVKLNFNELRESLEQETTKKKFNDDTVGYGELMEKTRNKMGVEKVDEQFHRTKTF